MAQIIYNKRHVLSLISLSLMTIRRRTYIANYPMKITWSLSQYKDVLPVYDIGSYDCLIFTMGFPIPLKRYLYIDSARHKIMSICTVYPKKYAHGFCFAVLCCGYTLTDFPISIRLTSLALWQSNDCPSASKATLMDMDKYFMWIHYERLHNHNKAKHNKTVCIFLGICCSIVIFSPWTSCINLSQLWLR